MDRRIIDIDLDGVPDPEPLSIDRLRTPQERAVALGVVGGKIISTKTLIEDFEELTDLESVRMAFAAKGYQISNAICIFMQMLDEKLDRHRKSLAGFEETKAWLQSGES